MKYRLLIAAVLVGLAASLLSGIACDTVPSSTQTAQPSATEAPSPTDTETPLTGTTTSNPTAAPSPTIEAQPPAISGISILPDLDVDAGYLTQVTLYDLAWNEIAGDRDSDPAYRFQVEGGSSYILIADYSNGPSIGAITPIITGEVKQDITIDTEVAMSLIVTTEQAFDNLLTGSLSRPLNDLLTDANKVVTNLNAFYDDRNTNRSADIVADAVYVLTMDYLNRQLPIYVDYLNEDTIRSYGGGLEGIRSLEEMADDPIPPLNPHFVFTRYNHQNQVDFGMSDLETKRWDFLGTNGAFPHIATGGSKVVFIKPTSTWINAISENVLGLYIRDLGTDTNSAKLLTPWNMECWTPSISPDQSKIAFAGRYIDNPDAIRQSWRPLDIYVIDIQTKNIAQVTHNIGLGGDRLGGSINPAWSPDGNILVFEYGIGGNFEDTRMDFVIVDDPDSRSTIMAGNGVDDIWRPSQPKFSPDGAQIVFSANVDDGGEIIDYEIATIPADYGFNGGQIRLLTDNTYDDSRPDWSYDGRFIMYSSNIGGEPGSMAAASEYLNPFYVINAYTGELVADMGDFANAGFYYGARFCGTQAVMATTTGTQKDSTGVAVISGSDSRKSSNSNSDYNYYRETIPAANNIVDAYGDPAYNYGVTSWW